ncbi:exocyst complex component EXO70B1 isoform X2 [Lathyrus oleraceus]|uniref:exocyst complex component EXO70B1 isoform X2 n=1 Tax=Pisum sativum TaxID=3888 RepID=UPI0021CFFC7B|nr:exocyst complex component EXO70B1-like isoform X2 [Pisum sativum]
MTPLLIQIQRWMMDTKVWRTWRDSRCLRFKAHSPFLVLVITSFYSFFSDKVLTGKPDLYSPISYAAFALMALSLSRQIQCGFEVDLMYFYLGCLIVQLMKIKLWFAIIGACYSYCLIILRSTFSSLKFSAENQYLEEQRIIIRVDSQQHENINTRSGTNLMQLFMTCMDELKHNNSNIAKMLLKKVTGNYKLVATDHNFIVDAIAVETINHLHKAVKSVVDAGFEKVCSELYVNMRKEWLESLLINKLLGLGKTGFQDYMIGRWIKVFKVALRILFPSERRLYDLVFSESTSISSDICFTKVCHGSTRELLNFADLFANRITSAWGLFKILDLFETIDDLIPEFESLFTVSLVNEAIKIKNKLGEISRDIFMEFENLIFLSPVGELDCWVDGGVHPMTCGAAGNILLAFWSRQNLEKVLREYSVVVADGAGKSLFHSRMELIMEQFERNLEAKSQIYEDLALRYFFMMNNINHIEYLLETFWDDRLCKNTRQYLELYCKNSWEKVIDLLKMDVDESVAPDSKADLTKDKLNLFNQKFKEMCRIQSKWRVFNKQLKKQIIIYVENMLMPAYENLIAKFENGFAKNADEYTMYGVSDIQDQLNNLFLSQDVEFVRGPVRNQLVSY